MPQSIPPPPHPINRKEGWKDSLPAKNAQSQQNTKSGPSTSTQLPLGTHYHYTSDIQERVDPQKIANQIWDQIISVSVKDLVGCSPALQKIVAEAARTKRSYVSNSNAMEGNVGVAELLTDEEGRRISSSLRVAVEDQDRLSDFLVRYSSAVEQVPTRKFFAMTTGIMDIKLGDVPFRAMIDTGSELNVASYYVPEQSRQVLDTEGMKWSLKGIHGTAEGLRGIILDADIKLGSHSFPHHIFVSAHKVSNQFDIILGQPFLQWYACRVEYWKAGTVKLFLWKDGDKTKIPHVSVSLIDPNDRRNTQTMYREPEREDRSNINYSSVEDVDEEEYLKEQRSYNSPEVLWNKDGNELGF